MAEESSVAGWLAESWSASLARGLEARTGAPVQVSLRVAPGGVGGAEEFAAADLLWWEQPLDLEGQPALCVGTPAATWRELGARVLRSSGVESAGDAGFRSAFLEVLKESLAGLAGSVAQQLGQEERCPGGHEILEGPKDGAAIDVEVTLEGAPLPPLRIILGRSLINALEAAPPGQALAVAGPVAPAAPGEAPPRTLDLLMEVELPVSVSFGRAELPLKDVLKLTTGSIVELNRTVEEPVELIVNNCVIARGEVVVVDGNYGVRIRQIVSPQERLRTLK